VLTARVSIAIRFASIVTWLYRCNATADVSSNRGYVNNDRHDFSRILRFVEHNFGIPEGALQVADERTRTTSLAFST
jgi:hypothetical protein